MRRSSLVVVLVCLAAWAVPSEADAVPRWSSRTVDTGGPASARGIIVLPDGRVATLLELGAFGSERTLELRVGKERTVLARSPHAFEASLDQDARGRITVVWGTSPTNLGEPRIFAWSRGRTQALSRGGVSSASTSFAEAEDGGAIVAYTQGKRLVTARRAPGQARFRPTEDLQRPSGGVRSLNPVVRVAAARGGRAVASYDDVVLRARSATTAFGAPVSFVAEGTQADADPSVQVDASGAATIAYLAVSSSSMNAAEAPAALVRWPADKAEPDAPLVLSQGPATTPVVVLTGPGTLVTFREQRGEGAVLRAVVLRADGTRSTSTSRVRGDVDAALTATGSGDGILVLTGDRNGVSALHVDARGRFGRSEVVMSDPGVFYADAARGAGRTVAIWTVRPRRAASSSRVRIAVR